MIDIKCVNCHRILRFDEQKLQPGQSSFRCPICKIRNLIPQPEISPTIINDDLSSFPGPGKLHIQGNHETGFPISLKEGVNSIGRKAETSPATLQINTDDKFMGRIHAQILISKDSCGRWNHFLSDLNSKNGTFHNDYRLQEGEITILMPGDSFRIGKTIIQIS